MLEDFEAPPLTQQLDKATTDVPENEEREPQIAVRLRTPGGVRAKMNNPEENERQVVEEIRAERDLYSEIVPVGLEEGIEVVLKEGIGPEQAWILYQPGEQSKVIIHEEKAYAQTTEMAIVLPAPLGYTTTDGRLVVSPKSIRAEMLHHVDHVHRQRKGINEDGYRPLWCHELADDSRLLEIGERKNLGREDLFWDVEAFVMFPDPRMPYNLDVSNHDVATRIVRTAEHLIDQSHDRTTVRRRMLRFALEYMPPVPLLPALGAIAAFGGEKTGLRKLEIENQVRQELGMGVLPENWAPCPQPEAVFGQCSQEDFRELSRQTGLNQNRVHELLAVLSGKRGPEKSMSSFESLTWAAGEIIGRLNNGADIVTMALKTHEVFIRTRLDPGIAPNKTPDMETVNFDRVKSERFRALEDKYQFRAFVSTSCGLILEGRPANRYTPEQRKGMLMAQYTEDNQSLEQLQRLVGQGNTPADIRDFDQFVRYYTALLKSRLRIIELQAEIKQALIKHMPVPGKFTDREYPNEIARLCDLDELRGELELVE